MGVDGQRYAPAALPPEETREAEWVPGPRAENVAPTGI